ncbi:MAG TPA: TIGR01841 family phasin [Burkholderiales bacterium]|nr:TIGR01841 family phasin [Burkholderiales bacterium]
MEAKADEVAVKALKGQLDTALRVIEAITEGSMKMRDAQLTAATEAHADAAATLKLLEKATDPQELTRIQSEWLAAGLQKSLGYWTALFTTMVETQTNIAKCMAQPAQAAVAQMQAPTPADTTPASMQKAMDALYKPWLETTQELLASVARSGVSAEKRAQA